MIKRLLELLDTIPLEAPYKSIAVCGILTIIITMSVIIIGLVIDKLEELQLKLLAKAFNHRIAYLIVNRFTFIGTIIHEYAHAFFAMLAGAKVSEIKCFDLGNNDQLGHCSFYTRGTKIQQMTQLSLSACAPVIIGLLFEFVLIKFVLPLQMATGMRVFVWYCIISIADHMSMSSTDIKNYCKGLLMLGPMLFAIIWISRLLLTKS
jgi:hypothetical protein